MTFRIGACRVRISFYFFALLAAAAAVPGEGTVLAAGMLAALVHECGHLCAIAALCRARINCIELTPLGMRIVTDAADDQCSTLPLTALSGAAANLAAAGMFYGLYSLLPSENTAVIMSANLCLAAINLLPAEPLDGGKYLHYLLQRRVNHNTAAHISFCVSIFAITMLTAAGVFVLLRSRYNFSLLFMGLWLFAAVIKDYVC